MSRAAGGAATVRRVALTGVILAAIALGAWGWVEYRAQRPDVDLDALAVVHGTIGLFYVAGDTESVPWQLDVGRILAPLATAGVLLEVGIVAGATRLAAVVARQASGHVVLVGPADRVRHHVSREVTATQPAVHVGRGDEVGTVPAIHVAVDEASTRWVAASHATDARRVVIARGRDVLNLGALAAALEAGIPADGQELTVEVTDPTLTRRLAVAYAVERPSQGIELVCPDEAHARCVAEDVMRSVAARPEDDPVRVAAIGDSPAVRATVERLAIGLRRWGSATSRTVPCLVVVDPDEEVAAAIRDRFADPSRLRVVAASSSAALDGGGEHPPAFAVVDFEDADRTARTVVELACSSPRAAIWVLRDDPLPAPGAELRCLSLSDVSRTGQLLGPIGRLAQLRQDAAAGRGLAAGDWAALTADDAARTQAVAEARMLVGVVARRGPVVPASELAGHGDHRSRRVMLDRDTLDQLEALDSRGFDDASELLEHLHEVGLAVPRSVGGS